MFVVLFVKESNTQVVEVETDDWRQALKPFPMAVKVIEQKDRVLSYVTQSLVARLVEQAQIHIVYLPLALYVSRFAAALQITFLPPGISG